MEAIWALYLVTTITAKIDLIIFQTFFPRSRKNCTRTGANLMLFLEQSHSGKKEREKADQAAVIYCCCD